MSIHILVLLIALLGPLHSMASECDSILSSKTSKFTDSDLTYLTSKFYPPETPTVEVQPAIIKEGTSSFMIFKKTGSSWWSAFTPAPDNYQGDPRWFAMSMGAKIAYYFGFRKISDDTITAPTPNTLNKQIKKINKVLILKNQEPIEIQFHVTGPKPETGIQYLQHILKNSSLPIAKAGHYAVHDLAYHSLAIMLPKKIITGVQSRIKILLKFMGAVKQSPKLSDFEKKVLKVYIDQAIIKMVQVIDYGTGNIGLILAMEKTKHLNISSEPYELSDLKPNVIYHLVKATQSVLDDLESDIESTFMNEIGHVYGTSYAAKYFVKDLPIDARQPIVESMQNNIKQFVKDFLKQETKSIEDSRQFISVEELISFVRHRIEAIDQAIPEIQ